MSKRLFINGERIIAVPIGETLPVNGYYHYSPHSGHLVYERGRISYQPVYLNSIQLNTESVSPRALSNWNSVQIGNQFKVLNPKKSPMSSFYKGDIIEIIDLNHTGFMIKKPGSKFGGGYVYYPDQLEIISAKDNEEAKRFLHPFIEG